MAFYQSVFGGELTQSTYAEFAVSQDPAEQDKIMHSQLETPAGLVLMAADVPDHMEFTEGSAHHVSLSGDHGSDAELRRYWDGLSDGATVAEPLAVAPWGDAFGMLVDRFGVSWMVNIAAEGR